MGFGYCEIRRDARIAGQPERRYPNSIHMASITDKREVVNVFQTKEK